MSTRQDIFEYNTSSLKNVTSQYCTEINKNNDFIIRGISLPWEPQSNTLIFIKYDNVLTDEIIDKLNSTRESVIIVPDTSDADWGKNNIIIKSKHPKWEFATILHYIRNTFRTVETKYKNMQNGAMISETAIIGNNVKIESNAIIDDEVTIGENCVIMAGAVLRTGCRIGKNTTIGIKSIIGGDEMDVAENDSGEYLIVPHLHGVEIGNNVIIGPANIIPAGVVNPTIIGDNVVTSGMTEIGHGAIVGKGTRFAGNATVCGCVEIGENCWIGPKTVIIDRTKIGNNSRVGIGSVVMRTVNENEEVLGNPARKINLRNKGEKCNE